MDIQNFYPSIRPAEAAKIARIMWEESTLEVENLDLDMLALYIGKHVPKEVLEDEKLLDVVYSKCMKKNTVKGKNVSKKHTKNRKMKNKNKKKHKVLENEADEKIAINVIKVKKPKIKCSYTWKKPMRSPTDLEVRKLFGLALERLINISMRNHVYSFNNVKRLQSEGGATGLDETGEVADLLMLWWLQKFVNVLDKLGLKTNLLTLFKDDLGVITDKIPIGMAYENKVLVAKNTEILEGNISDEIHTAKIFCQIANEIVDMLKFTYDTPEMNSDGFMPILDLKAKLSQNGKVIHQFYEKKTKNRRVILASSALSWSQKRTILTQEALRRLKNTSSEMGVEAQNLHLSDFMLKLKDSGYDEKFRKEIVSSAKMAYEKMKNEDFNGKKPLYRNREQMKNDRESKKGSNHLWWQKSPNIKYTAVMFVPPTPNGVLMKMMREREKYLNENSKMRIKFVEKGGIKFKNIISKKNPFKAQKCSESKCPLCHETKFTILGKNNIDACDTPNVGYRISCNSCEATYEGETARLLRSRALEHVKDLEKGRKTSPLVKHLKKYHPTENPKFEITLTKKFFDSLSRQADEGVRIKSASKTPGFMNSKSEFNHNHVNRVSLVKTDLTQIP